MNSAYDLRFISKSLLINAINYSFSNISHCFSVKLFTNCWWWALCLFAIYNESHFEVGCLWKIVIWIRIWKVRFPFLCEETHSALLAPEGMGWSVAEKMDWKGFSASLSASSKMGRRYEIFWKSKKLVMSCLISVGSHYQLSSLSFRLDLMRPSVPTTSILVNTPAVREALI